MQKWNPKARKYEEYKIPSHWNTPLYTDNMNEIINCAHCGKKLTYGECYTSKQIHNQVGMGYGVCEECYRKECEEERNAN